MPVLLRLRDLVYRLLTPLGVAVFLLEDVLIRRLGRLLGRLAALPMIARAEAWAARLPPYGALALFLLPSALIVGEKVLVILLFHHHRYWLGLGTLVFAKLFVTAAIGRILSVCHPSLSQLAWYCRADAWVRATRDRIHGAIRGTALWRTAQRVRQRLAAANPFAELRGRLRGGRTL